MVLVDEGDGGIDEDCGDVVGVVPVHEIEDQVIARRPNRYSGWSLGAPRVL
jgi:hypothetical protein